MTPMKRFVTAFRTWWDEQQYAWERDLAAWDIAAGILIVREAQGVATDLTGGSAMLDKGSILAANDPLHPQLLKMLKGAGK